MYTFKQESKQIWQDKSISAKKRKAKIEELEKLYKSGALNTLTSEPGISSFIPTTILRNLTYGFITSKESIYRGLNSPFEVLMVMNLIRIGPYSGGSNMKKGKAEHEFLTELKNFCIKEIDTMGLQELIALLESIGLTGLNFDSSEDLGFQMNMIDKHTEELFMSETNPGSKLKLGCKMIQVYGGSGIWQFEKKWLDLVFDYLELGAGSSTGETLDNKYSFLTAES
jgi:hypothetical protein